MYFNKPYIRQEFLTLLQTKIFPNFVRQERPLQINRKTAYFVNNNVYKLGVVELDKEIHVLEIQQKSSKDPRITLTKDAFKVLDDNGIDNALVIFYSQDNTSYRFSLLTTKYIDWDKKETSSYKRFSYILGPGAKTKTPEKQLLHTIKDYNDLVSRFDVEVVRKDFFEKYLELYVRLYKEIKKEESFTELLKSQQVDLVSFTKNLLGKIVFLYFIQQKGWLGLGKKETEYGKGNKNFMRVMRDNFENNNESMSTEKTGYFYNDYLERLFFEGLNKDRRDTDDWFPNLQMKVPYLNGGLFTEDYQGRDSYKTKISNDIFSNVTEKGDEADGILDIFDRYNFTVDEDSLYDSDIAVDPEMLGRIFEKMISISHENIDKVVELYDAKGEKSKIDFGKELNKKLGAFYTPREIVHYMTKESLIAYLVNNIKGDKEQNEKLIRDLFELKEQFLLSKEDLTKTNFSSDIFDKLGGIIEQIDDALKKVKILDPAVGSGAFPMGLLHEVSSIRYYIYGVFYKTFGVNIDTYKNTQGKISLYKIKREIILNNIYGVDIDPGAIDIARLRFRLSLVVDEEQPEPLPNFEFKFVCANTLIPLEEETKEKDLFAQGDEPKLETLKKYKKEYYNASGNKEKQQLKERIRDYTKIDTTLFSEPTPRAKQMAEFGANFDNSKHSHSFFDPSLMMSEWRGFDIIIGNPPYISYYSKQSQGNKDLESLIDNRKKNYNFIQDKKKLGRFNTVMFFLEKGFNLMKEKGVVNFIIDTNFYSNPFKDIRKFLLQNTSINEIITNIDAFEGVASKQVIIRFSNQSGNNIIRKTIKENNFITLGSEKKEKYFGNFELYPPKNEFMENLRKKISSNKNLLDLLGKNNVRTCITFTGQKDKFIVDKKDLDIDYPLLEGGKSVTGPYKPISFQKYIRYDLKLRDKLNHDYIKLAEVEGKRTPMVIGLGDLERFRAPKLFIRLSDVRITATYTEEEVCADLSLYIITFDNKKINQNGYNLFYFLGILNSSIVTFYARNFEKIKNLGKGTPQIRLKDVRELPIPEIDFSDFKQNEKHKYIVDSVDQILSKKKENPKADTSELEKEIDQMVYGLYGLSDEEVRVVEESLHYK